MAKTRNLALLTIAAALFPAVAAAEDGLRIACWNISNYTGGRANELSTAIYAEFDGRSMRPDILVCQEILSQSATNTLLSILNSAPGSPGDWAAAPFIDGPDTDGAMYYRTSRASYLGMAILPADPGTTGAPRNVYRYDIAIAGYEAPATQLAIYSVHMKAGSSSSDQARRLIEARRIRDDAEALDPAINIIVAGDFNIQSSSQAAYQELTGPQANNNGRFADPINTPGSWNNNFSFRFIHTQDPSGAGGMDDRHDQILVDPALGDGTGLEYRGLFAQPYATTTWDDPNHSYRCWGNDGTSYNVALTVANNSMVGPSSSTSTSPAPSPQTKPSTSARSPSAPPSPPPLKPATAAMSLSGDPPASARSPTPSKPTPASPCPAQPSSTTRAARSTNTPSPPTSRPAPPAAPSPATSASSPTIPTAPSSSSP